MQPSKPGFSRNTIILIGILAVGIIFVVGVYSSRKPPAGPTKATTSYDKTSGETTRTIPGESNTDTAGAPVYLGLGPLLDKGVSQNQLQNMETGFYRYVTANKLATKQVSIAGDTLTTGVQNQGTVNEVNTIDFTVVLDSKNSLHASLHYSGLNDAELFLFNNQQQQIYDSGVISASSVSGD